MSLQKGEDTAANQQECSEIHTIQLFREASMIRNEVTVVQSSVNTTPIPFLKVEVYNDTKENAPNNLSSNDDGIGGDWAIDDDEVMLMDDTTNTESVSMEGGQSSLYSFYFETSVTNDEKAQNAEGDNDDDCFTIDTESLQDAAGTDLNLTSLQDSSSFWESGLAAAPTMSLPEGEERCISPAHVSVSGEEQLTRGDRNVSEKEC